MQRSLSLLSCPPNHRINTQVEYLFCGQIAKTSNMSARIGPIARERNEIGLSNFIESLRSLFIQIQNINVQELDSEYVETTSSHLEDAVGTLQLLIDNIRETTDDPVLNDFKVILETVLGQARLIHRMLLLVEERSENRQSFACSTATAQGRGRPVLLVQRE